MPRRSSTEDEGEWEGEGDEGGHDDGTMACPYCKREIHEDAQRCPHCESYISEEDTPRQTKPWWIILGVLVCLYVVYRWIMAGG